MKKLRVASGIYWVEIPEVGLYIQCGCPADSVKHLMAKGLIAVEDKGGVLCETGPNVILLSDLSTQKEAYANLAEFPVLQMLYRQGMLLPNHPNNTGVLPMIMGTEHEVKAQSEYIYRGNYGLSSVEELIEAGVPEAQAREMMRLKLKFAFGNIKETQAFIETRIVMSEPIEIRNGAFIRRLKTNLFEITYKDEVVTVDLNLAPNEQYEVSYKLDFHEIKRAYFSIVHTGEGDGWDKNRPCMASIISFQGRYYLIDAGPNIVYSLHALGIGINEIEGIFHTHAHDDHFNGLAALMRSDHRLKYYSTKLVRTSVMKKLMALTAMNANDFEKFFEIHDLEVDKWNDTFGLEVMPTYSPHPVETNVLTFRALWSDGYKYYAHLADIIDLKILKNMIVDDSGKNGITEAYYEKTKKLYMKKADIKKIDIGGGLIHGNAEDFRHDASKKVLLSHTASPLTEIQKEIGDDTTFGTTDVLISSDEDYLKNLLYGYLSNYFPEAPKQDLDMLLNCPIESINPGTILIRKGQKHEHLYLVASGLMEFINSDTGSNNKLTIGMFAGEMSGVMKGEARGTFRTISYVKALKISNELYIKFLKHNHVYNDFMSEIDRRIFLQNTWLFGEKISCALKSTLIKHMTMKTFIDGEVIPVSDEPGIYLLYSGDVSIISDNTVFDQLAIGDFVGEACIVDGAASAIISKVNGAAQIYFIPKAIFKDIPIVYFKLVETLERRKLCSVQRL